jgi:hypothetical protein
MVLPKVVWLPHLCIGWTSHLCIRCYFDTVGDCRVPRF